MLRASLRNFLALLLLPAVCGLHAYGHAYSRPDDFTPAQYAEIVKRFTVFTVEKDHAASVYGNASAEKPYRTNSIASSVGTARNIKKYAYHLNASIKVLMYWNTALFFDLYECEAEVDQARWLKPPMKHGGPRLYNYSVPAFRAWWVKCAIDAVTNSNGALDGLFLDATPKLEAVLDYSLDEGHLLGQHGAGHTSSHDAGNDLYDSIQFFGAMVDELKTAMPHAFIVDNGFYLTKSGKMDGGEDVWSHTQRTYVESLEKIGNREILTTGLSLKYLTDLSNASSAHPSRMIIGHGTVKLNSRLSESIARTYETVSSGASGASVTEPEFFYGLAKYLMVTSSVKDGYFLANDGSYSIDGGLLNQPTSVYAAVDGVGCGEPIESYFTTGGASGFVVQREFEKGVVEIDLVAETGKINCKGRQVAF